MRNWFLGLLIPLRYFYHRLYGSQPRPRPATKRPYSVRDARWDQMIGQAISDTSSYADRQSVLVDRIEHYDLVNCGKYCFKAVLRIPRRGKDIAEVFVWFGDLRQGPHYNFQLDLNGTEDQDWTAAELEAIRAYALQYGTMLMESRCPADEDTRLLDSLSPSKANARNG